MVLIIDVNYVAGVDNGQAGRSSGVQCMSFIRLVYEQLWKGKKAHLVLEDNGSRLGDRIAFFTDGSYLDYNHVGDRVRAKGRTPLPSMPRWRQQLAIVTPRPQVMKPRLLELSLSRRQPEPEGVPSSNSFTSQTPRASSILAPNFTGEAAG